MIDESSFISVLTLTNHRSVPSRRGLAVDSAVRIQRRAINTIREQEVPQNVSLDGQDTRDKERDLPLNNMQSNFERLWSKFIEKKRMEELRQRECETR